MKKEGSCQEGVTKNQKLFYIWAISYWLIYLSADLDLESQKNADPDPDPGQTSPSQEVKFLHEKYTLQYQYSVQVRYVYR